MVVIWHTSFMLSVDDRFEDLTLRVNKKISWHSTPATLLESPSEAGLKSAK